MQFGYLLMIYNPEHPTHPTFRIKLTEIELSSSRNLVCIQPEGEIDIGSAAENTFARSFSLTRSSVWVDPD